MKTVIITVPMKPLDTVKTLQYPVDGNKTIEYDKPVRCPLHGVLAKTMEKDEQVKVIHILAIGGNSEYKENSNAFKEELENINKEVGAILEYDTVEIDFLPTKQTYNKLITDLSEKIPVDAEIYADTTYGFKPESISLFCALRFAEEFRDAVVQYIIYGKAEFKDNQPVNPMLYDITSLYYLFKLMGTMGAATAEDAAKTLKDFFEM